MTVKFSKMKCLFLFVFFIFSADGQAQQVKTKADTPEKMWKIVTHSKDKKDNKEDLLILQRYVSFFGEIVPVSTITQTTLRRENSKVLTTTERFKEAQKFAEMLRSATKTPKWTIEKKPDQKTFIFRADWPKQNRFVQLLYKDLGNTFIFSTASTRRVFLYPIGTETAYLQQFFAADQKTKTSLNQNKFPPDIFKLFFPEAQAQGSLTPYLSLNYGGQTLNLSGLSGPQLANLGKTLTSSLGTDVNSFLQQVSPTVNQTIQSLGKAGGVAVQSLAQPTINSAAAAANSVVAQANSDVNKLTSTGNLVRMGAALGASAAAGGVLGGIAMNFLVDGTAQVLSDLWHSAMGTLTEDEKSRERQDVARAFDELGKSSEQLINLQKQIDARLAALSRVSLFPTADLVDRQIELNNAEVAHLRHQLENGLDQVCADKIVAINRETKTLTDLKNILENEGGVQGACTVLQKMFRGFLNAEFSLHNAQTTLSTNAAAILSDISAQFVASVRRVGSDRKDNNFCRQNEADLERIKSSMGATTSCEQKMLEGLRASPNFSSDDLTNARIKQQCSIAEQVLMSQKITQAMQTCVDAYQARLAQDRTLQLEHGITLTTANMQSAQQAISEIAQSDCEEGIKGGVCDGTAGSYQVFRAVYDSRFNAAKAQHCPNLQGPQLDHPPTMMSYADPSSVSVGRQALSGVTTEQRPDFLTRVGDSVTQTWHSVCDALFDI